MLSLLLSSRLSDVSSKFCCAEPEVACSRFDSEKIEEEACAGANPASAIRATAADSSIAFAAFLEFIEPNILNSLGLGESFVKLLNYGQRMPDNTLTPDSSS